MSAKRKFILMGICVGIILLVLTVNVVRRIRVDNPGSKTETVKENVMTRAEAYRLLSYLEYDKSERDALTNKIHYSDEQMSGWYDTYVNAVCRMGLIDSNITVSPKKALTYGYCKELTDKLILENPAYQAVYKRLSFQFTKADHDMLIADFLELYQALLDVIPKEERKVSEDTLLLLGREVTDDNKDRMVTDQGKYYYLNAKNYINYFTPEQKEADKTDSRASDKQITPAVKDTDQNLSQVTAAASPTAAVAASNEQLKKEIVDKDSSDDMISFINEYMDKGIRVLVCDQEIIYITSVTTEKIMVHNVWIKEGRDQRIDAFINDIDKSFSTVSKIKTPLEKVVGDITIENQKIVKINVKPDMIRGKVLRSGSNYIEIAGYGKVPLEENFKIYKIYGGLSVEPTGSILVGYDNTDFIVSNGKISAALITESIKAKNIRVLLKTTGYKGIYHSYVEFTATSDFTVSSKKKDYSFHKGDKVTLKPGDELFQEGRLTVKADTETAKIKLLSIERAYGNPKYRGTIEISEDENGLILVNELPLEEYLYAVIPSEMPTSYGIEALKVQAVCARSYAYRHLLSNSLSDYGAHVDDSASYQVYNNTAENEDSILAVKDTYGEVIKYDNEVITAYYYSTSCGHTTGPSGVWSNSTDLPYLKGKLLIAEKGKKAVLAQSMGTGKYEDLSSEKTFKKFITANDITTYDSSYSWYRWKVTLSTDHIKQVIDNTLKERYQSSPDMILTKTGKAEGGKEAVYESVPIDTVGEIENISVLKRESSGIISELLIKGSKNTIKVLKDYNIRALLAPSYDTVIRQDESQINGLSLLPSSYFIIEKDEKKGKLSGFRLTGGGFGHGVGMSQNAVKTLVDSGKNYKEIASYFYEGTQVGSLY